MAPRIVFDTDVILASQLSKKEQSANTAAI